MRADAEPYRARKKVVILGAGMMGAAIAYVSAKAGIEVVLKDVSLEAAERGKQYSVNLVNKADRPRPLDSRSRARSCWPGSTRATTPRTPPAPTW